MSVVMGARPAHCLQAEPLPPGVDKKKNNAPCTTSTRLEQKTNMFKKT